MPEITKERLVGERDLGLRDLSNAQFFQTDDAHSENYGSSNDTPDYSIITWPLGAFNSTAASRASSLEQDARDMQMYLMQGDSLFLQANSQQFKNILTNVFLPNKLWNNVSEEERKSGAVSDVQLFRTSLVKNELLYRFYRPQGSWFNKKKLPTLFFIPETFFLMRETSFTDYFCSYLAEQGNMNVVALYPRTVAKQSGRNDIGVKTMLADCEAIMSDFARNAADVEKNAYFNGDWSIAGYGSGAYLALQIIAKKPKAFSRYFMIDPFVDFDPQYLTENDKVIPRQFLGFVKKLFDRLSPEERFPSFSWLDSMNRLWTESKSHLSKLSVILFPDSVYNNGFLKNSDVSGQTHYWPAKPASDVPPEKLHTEYGHMHLWFNEKRILNFADYLLKSFQFFPKVRESKSELNNPSVASQSIVTSTPKPMTKLEVDKKQGAPKHKKTQSLVHFIYHPKSQQEVQGRTSSSVPNLRSASDESELGTKKFR